MPLDSWTINDGTYLYSHQPTFGPKVVRIKIPREAQKSAAAGSPPFTGGMKGKVLGKANMLGKSCEIRDSGGVKLWVWKNLVLKAEQTAGPGTGTVMVATKLETPVKLPASHFKVPAGLQVQDVDTRPGRPAAPPKR